MYLFLKIKILKINEVNKIIPLKNNKIKCIYNS